MPQATLIIAVYNQARNLELILESVETQTFRDIEIIVADDGSSDETESVIHAFRSKNPDIPVEFVTQEDMGFRKTMILNKAIAKSSCDYLIFIDGDMILERHFIEMHMRYRKINRVLCGHRGVKLTESYTKSIVNGECLFIPTLTNIFIQRFKGGVENPARGLIIHNALLRRLAVPGKSNLSGCNFSLYREAIEKVNGFNEDILQHGFNDYELGHRLKLAGYTLVNVSKLCVTYHLYHTTRKTQREETRKKIDQVDKSVEFYCRNGLVKERR